MKFTSFYMQFATLAAALAASGYAEASVLGALDPKDLDRRSSKKAKDFSFNDLYGMQTKFLDSFLSPNNSIQVILYEHRPKLQGIVPNLSR